MKKIITYILIVLLMFGCGVGGYFLRDSIENKKFEIAVAQNTIRKIAHNANFVENEAPAANLNSLALNSNESTQNYTNYEGTQIDYNGKEQFIKIFVSLLYYAIDGEVNASTYYISSAKYMVGATEVEGIMTFNIKLTDKQAYFYIADIKNNMSMVMVVSSENNTRDHYQIDGYMTGTFSAQPGLVYFKICSDNEKITQFAYSEVQWFGDVNTVNDITADSVYRITVFDCNLSTGRIMNKNQENITDEEKVDFATRTMKEFYCIEIADVIYKNFVESDFLWKAYKSLGYNVI